MRLSFARVGLAIATASVSLLPLVSAHAQFSGTNGQIYFRYIQSTPTTYTAGIAAANIDGSESHMVVPIVANKQVTSFEISPDGSKLAYVLNDTTNPSDNFYSLILSNSDGSSPQTIFTAPHTSGYTTIGALHFKSDGTTLFFYEGNNVATDGIYSVPVVVASTPTQLIADTYGSGTQTNRSNFVVWLNKFYIAKSVYASSVTTNTITTANLDGTGEGILYTPADTTKRISAQDVSPDGVKLSFISQDSIGHSQLYTVNTADGTGLTALTSSPTEDVQNSYYSPDNTKIVYFSNSTSGGNTVQAGSRIMNADGTGTAVAFRTNAEAPMWSTVAAATTGTFPAVLGDSAQGQVVQTGTGGGTGAPALPDAGHSSSKAPIALAIIATLAVIGIEAGRRVRIRR